MTTLHQEIIALLAAAQASGSTTTQGSNYLGSSSECYQLSNPAKYKIARVFVKNNPNVSYQECIQLLTDLSKGASYEEKSLISSILVLYPAHRAQLTPAHLDVWLENLSGWGEIDSLCQSLIDAEELLAQWQAWRSALIAFSISPNISKRRASLVLLTRPVRDQYDSKLGILALQVVAQLQSERDILITKAISWLLREMVKNYCSEVVVFLAVNDAVLPKIALREVSRKLATGRK